MLAGLIEFDLLARQVAIGRLKALVERAGNPKEIRKKSEKNPNLFSSEG